jgi:hypothetical protein
MEQKHSGLGIASFILSCISGFCLFFTIFVAGIIEASNQGESNDNTSLLMLVGFSVLAFLFVALIASGLGIAGLIQKDRNKIYAVFGTIFSASAILVTLYILVVGLRSNS